MLKEVVLFIRGNFRPATDYEWHTKAWCIGNVDEEGNSDIMYHSGWGDFNAFSTEENCNKLPINLSTTGYIPGYYYNFITMSWDTPQSGPHHYFLELKMKILVKCGNGIISMVLQHQKPSLD